MQLYSLDGESSYQHAFIYVRQLSLHLRAAVANKTKEAYKQVYNWQYLNCLRLWFAVVAANCKGDDRASLRELVYPLCEVAFGVLRLITTTMYLPMRLHCVRLLQQIAAKAEVFVPTASVLLAMLDSSELYKKRKPNKNAGEEGVVNLSLMIKFGKDKVLTTQNALEHHSHHYWIRFKTPLALPETP